MPTQSKQRLAGPAAPPIVLVCNETAAAHLQQQQHHAPSRIPAVMTHGPPPAITIDMRSDCEECRTSLPLEKQRVFMLA
ncbi:hypothetical protein J1614_008593 [Plenodomus biglobosus]|nr:hypothetical protein J1614_008593 [Plenodomus biglobosus]